MHKLSPDVFLKFVSSALENLPQTVHDALDNVEIVTQEWPSSDQVDGIEQNDYYQLLGLYEGVPLVERANYTMVLPDRVTLFQRPLEAMCATPQELQFEIQTTIVHELAHHLGWGDEDIHRMGFG